MTHTDFFEAYRNGQHHFLDLDFEYLDGFANRDFSNVIFENCFLYVDFRSSNLTSAQFIGCNIKEIDLRKTNLANALMINCLVESALFKGAIVNNFRFIDNYYYGLTVGQKEFDEKIIHTDAYILTTELTEKDYKDTMSSKMSDVTGATEPTADLWGYVKWLAYENIVPEYVFQHHLIEKVYRNDNDSIEHFLLQGNRDNTFVVIVISVRDRKILGYYLLDLAKEYGTDRKL